MILGKPIKIVPVKLPENGESFLIPQNLEDTIPYTYRVRLTCIETSSKGDFSKVKDASVAVGDTDNALPQEAVFDALHKSINKQHVIKEASTECAFRELLSELERVKFDDKVWIVSKVKRQSELRLQSGNSYVELGSEKNANLGALIRTDELQIILGGKIDANFLADVLSNNNGIIDLKGIILKDPIEINKIEQFNTEVISEISPFLQAPAVWKN